MARCFECGKDAKSIKGDLEFNDPQYGPFQVRNVDYGFCEHCNEVAFIPYETSIKIDEQRELFRLLKGK